MIVPLYKAAYLTDKHGREYLVAYTSSVGPEYYVESFIKSRSDLTFINKKPRIENVRIKMA